MITTPRDYYALYHRIQSENAPSIAILLPTDEKIYSIDLNTREVEAPEYLSVEKDHKAEVIYFKVNRYYDFFDLTQSVCVIEYVNAAGEPRAYVVPYYDVDTLSEDDMILFPWVIGSEVTKSAGVVEFRMRFYKLTDTGSYYLYNLNTLPVTSKVLYGMTVQGDIEEENDYLASLKDDIYQKIADISGFDLYWEESE